MSADPRTGRDAEELRRRLQAALGDRYVLERELGSGGTGTVFAAVDRKHERPVAVKVLRPEFAASLGAGRFLREIRIAARLTHPHIVPLHDSGEADGLLYFVMALMEGESLQALLDREGPLPVPRAVAIARQICEALGHAHASGVVHRDVKPGNILLAGPHALLADFGIARRAADSSDTLTITGLAVGTPAYMSPEQVTGEAEVDERSDVYSLGCVLYEMLAGQRPFRGSVAGLAGRFLANVRPLREVRPEVPPALAAAVERALAADPAERFQSAAELSEALKRAKPRRSSWITVGAAALVVASIVALLDLTSGGAGAADLTDRAGSVVVLPFRDATQTREDVRLLVDLTDELTRQLNRWDSIRAVPQVALAGVVFDLGLRGPTLERIEDGLRTARALGVGTLIALSARAQGDSVAVTAARYDARAGRQLGKPLESRGPRADPFRLAAGIVHGILGLSGPIEDIERLREHSSNPAALQRYDAGLDLMERWRLAEAARAFREAVALDSTFAMAHHHLAQVLYWQGAGQTGGLARLGPEAVRLSRTALRHTEGLAAWEREHVAAFNRFLEGDYQQARERYGALLARDSTDVYAWLLGAIVEFRDPWLAQGADGSLRPRGDLNAAVRAFTETTRLNPGFHIGYGHLFDITSAAFEAATARSGKGFERPGHELVPVWQSQADPSTMEAFGLVYSDSLTWLPVPEFEAVPRARLEDGALRLLETSLRTLRRWAAYAPDEHRPHAELATWTMRQRDLLPSPQPPERLDSLAEAALLHAERSLELVDDTVPEDVIRLANVSLAAGRAGRARELVLSAVERSAPDDPLPRATSNALLFTGDVATALAVVRRESAVTRFWEDPATGRMLHDGGTEPLVRRLVTLGATGASEGLAEAFAELEAAWATPSEGRMPIERLRAQHAPSLAPALAMHPEALARWRVEGDLSDPLWNALALDTSDRPAALRAALAEPDPQVPDPIRSYLMGTAALEAGDAGLALRLLHRLDSIPLGADNREDLGWGLLALSLYRRGQALELRGDTAAAIDSFRRFLETRAGVASAPFADPARERLARLGAGGP